MKIYLWVILAVIIGMVISSFPLFRRTSVFTTPQKLLATLKSDSAGVYPKSSEQIIPPVINQVQPPAGYSLLNPLPGSFGDWLQKLPLRQKDNTVYLYNGSKKQNQTCHYAVLDVPYNRNQLQQCADVIMRLRAEYLYETKAQKEIRFLYQHNRFFTCPSGCTRPRLEAFLDSVFTWCGTYNLQAQLNPVANIQSIKSGDVFINGGAPGHAMLVVAVARNKSGQKVFLLLQGFMPAQDIHLVVNPYNQDLSPWYAASALPIATPGYTFVAANLRQWE